MSAASASKTVPLPTRKLKYPCRAASKLWPARQTSARPAPGSKPVRQTGHSREATEAESMQSILGGGRPGHPAPGTRQDAPALRCLRVRQEAEFLARQAD